MSNKRRNQSGAIRFVPAVKAILLCTLLGGSAAGFVIQKNKLHRLGQDILKLETKLERLRWENKVRATQLANLQLPQKIADRVKDMRLGLVPPNPGQMIWLREPLREKTTNTEPQLLAVRNGVTWP